MADVRIQTYPEASRRERKYKVTHLSEKDLVTLIRVHPANFSELFPPRNVNNIYFDTNDLRFYFDTIDGHANRMKVRIRWYGQVWKRTDNPSLEFKLKRGTIIHKKVHKISPLTVNKSLKLRTLNQIIFDLANTGLRPNFPLKMLKPVLVNRYYRRYYLSRDGKFRATIDSRMEYYKLTSNWNNYLRHKANLSTCILEIKYNPRDENNFHQISSTLPLRLTKSSKYIDGLDYF